MKKRLTAVVITRHEGPAYLCDKPVTIARTQATLDELWALVDDVISKWAAESAPESGYDKCEIVLSFEDGFNYRHRYDLTRRPTSPRREIWETLAAHAGRHRPPHMSPEQYDRFVNRGWASDEQKAEYGRWLDDYEIG